MLMKEPTLTLNPFPESQQPHAFFPKSQQKEVSEHGVSGQNWPVRTICFVNPRFLRTGTSYSFRKGILPSLQIEVQTLELQLGSVQLLLATAFCEGTKQSPFERHTLAPGGPGQHIESVLSEHGESSSASSPFGV